MPTSKKRQYSKIHPIHKKRLRDLAEKHGQVWVAQRIGISDSGVSRLLQAGDHGVRPSTLEAIVELVGKNGVEDPGPKPVAAKVRRAPEGDLFTAVGGVLNLLSPLSNEERVRVMTAVNNLLEGGGP